MAREGQPPYSPGDSSSSKICFMLFTDWELLTATRSFGCPRREAFMMTLDQIDLADLDFFVNRDIHEAFHVLRREDPVHWQERQPGRGFWSLTKYDDILAIYRDPLGFSSAQGVSLSSAKPRRIRAACTR
jgi:hypothetical protein